ncbi:unnamed protein product [Adineta steineri]|uniref:Large ribosomal subunit protein P2 n=1 Tax=Adineta steineri TaxID=433720 RepID=A0A814MVA5_9BILA|nr:unnamed protein product [Adineta steineri]CAF3750046.1 unnamed protein product [Adineta steineri]
MRYSAAYLLAVLGGNPSPSVADITNILGSVGIECDEKRAQEVIDACKGRSVDDIIASGMKKIDDLSMIETQTVATIDNESLTTTSTAPILIAKNSTPLDSPLEGSPEDNEFIGLFD